MASLILGLTLVVAALLAFSGSTAFAQVTGKVIGTVTDRDTGQPLVGAQVVIDGTNLGNVSNEDGYYFINNVPVGMQRITAQYLGYQVTSNEQRILAGQTMTVDFALASEVVVLEGIVAEIEREPLVARDNTVSKTRFTSEEMQGMPVTGIAEIITLGAGVYNSGFGLIIRGGRGTESATYVDGALVTDFASQQRNTDLGTYAVEEIDVITGGFNAEFGHAQSGIVNIVTREGGREYHGNVRFTTDGRFSTNGYSDEDGDGTDLDDFEEQKCCGFNSLQASIGGPIIPEKLTAFASMDVIGAADIDPRSAGFNPAVGVANSSGSTETILPGNRGDRTRLQGKLTGFLTGSSKLTGTYLFSRDQDELFSPGVSIFQYISGGLRIKTHDVILGYDQEVFQTAERNLNLQVRGNFHQTKLATGPVLNPETAALMRERIGDECGADCDAADEHTFDDDFLNYRIGDVKFFFEDAFPGDQNRLNVGSTRALNPDPVFGVTRQFVTEGFSNGFNRRDEKRYGIRVDLDSQLNRVHRGKVGAEWTNIQLETAGVRFTDATFAQVYDVEPRIGAAYVQDRLDYGDLVIDLGLRLDHFDPNADFPLFAGVVGCDISVFEQCTQNATTVEGSTQTELSPRLGVAHPITDATQVRLSYGKFHQLPELRHYYSSFLTDFSATAGNSNILYGNPNLDYIETTAFEAGITHLINENLVLDVVGYNRDRRGAIRLDVFQSGTIDPAVKERRIYINGDNGNVKGLDLTLNKRYANYFSTDIAYSLQWARGTTASPTDFATGAGFGRNFDPLFPGRLLTPPTELQPEAFDRLHTINTQFNLRFPEEFRDGTTMGTVFNDFSVYVIYNARSGEPYTRRGLEGQSEALEDLGSSRLPWVHSGDIRVSKGFGFGEALHLDLFAFVQNFLDIQNVVGVNSTTGRPDRTGFETVLNQNPQISGDLRTDGSGATDFPLALTDIVEEFRDEFSRQDLDGNGTIELAEAQETLRNALIATGDGCSFGCGGDSVFNYGAPRQVRFGAELRF
ncbi:MAG: TonB-dependent receptor domain-containing protein [Gemmatimonadota bacterium]